MSENGETGVGSTDNVGVSTASARIIHSPSTASGRGGILL